MSSSPHHGFVQDLLQLPESPDLGIRHLAAVFRHTTNAYKFYWFLALLETVKNGMDKISFQLLTAEMLAQVWYPVLMFRLHFGPQDQLSQLVRQLQAATGLPVSAAREDIRDHALLLVQQDKAFGLAFKQLQRFVPQRFLSPWFVPALRGLKDQQKDAEITRLAQIGFSQPNPPLYRLETHPGFTGLVLHPDWMSYLYTHFSIVRGFVLWSLLEYLYQRNPHVPNLPEKLFPPQQRDLKAARRYWEPVLTRYPLRCLYSDQDLTPQAISLDHFLPWRFVCHDQLWNLVPVLQPVNSAKSDRLPALEHYLSGFASLQYLALQHWLDQPRTPARQLEDFTSVLQCDLTTLRQMPEAAFAELLGNVLAPLEQIAANMGFVRGWIYLR